MIKVLEETARACGDILIEERFRGLHAIDKDETLGAHFSTQADERSQEHAVEVLHTAFPGVPVIAEEQKYAEDVPPNCFVVDPLDGTTAYFNGCREYGVTICRIHDGRPQAGVMYFPEDRMMISAVSGQGCFVNGERLRIRHTAPLDKTMLGFDVGPWTPLSILESLVRRFCFRSLMSAMWGEREVLLGQTGAYLNLNVAKIWDAAAGVLAVQEAGGIACAPDGSELHWNRAGMDWVIAANEEFAKIVLEATRLWLGRVHTPHP